MKKIILFSATALFFLQAKAQQDKNMSTWYQSQVLYNPAAVSTGAEDYSFYTGYRAQWLTVPNAGMRTNTLNAEFKIRDGAMSKNSFGVGLSAVNDQTGDASFMTTSVSIPFNYTVALDRNNKFSVGLSPGFYQQSVNRGSQTWENQWTGINFLNSSTNTELSLNSSYTTIDLGTGLYYQHTTRNKSSFYAGYALNHLTRQKINFSFGGDKLYMNMVVQAGADLTTKRRDFHVQPSMIFFRSGPSYNLTAGCSFEHTIKEGSEITNINKSNNVTYGVYYRHNDAVIVTVGMKIKAIKFGMAFDANYSKLSQATSSVGAVEVYFKSLLYYKKMNHRGKLR
ncbi:MAG: PorP/SprF family type IX secretion system membrane protein [Flavobacteriales bacterium]